jgi:eukaryotic-like serine/threonine-protein kinase
MDARDPSLHSRAKALFAQALDVPADQRRGFVEKAAEGDEALAQRVHDLLSAEDPHHEFLREPTGAGLSNLGSAHHDAPTAAHARSSSHAEVVAAVAALSEQPGSRIGPYKLLQVIGEGGFGRVFMAEQEHPVRRKVALKIIKLGMDTRQVVARFEQERQALALMDHPNIAKVLDAGATETGRPFFVMELCAGEPITTYSDKHNLGISQRLELFVQVCHAVQHAHQKGVIHRDIKPSNILVSTHDGRAHAKVIDFGIAKATLARLTERTLFTEHRQFIGTPEYMSPEQAEGSLDIDTRTDVYSLGVLLYELLTGSTPFDSKSLRSAAFGELQRIIREVDPPTPSTRLSEQAASLPSVAALRRTEPRKLNALIRGELDWIVMKSLEKDRARRYESPSTLAADVQRHLSGQHVHAAPPSAMYKARKFVRRHRAAALAASLIGIALLVGAVGTTIGFVNASRQRDQARVAQGNAEAVTEFLTKVLSSADPSAMGKDVTVRQVIDKAARNIDPSIQQRPGVEARVREAIGRTYLALGEYSSAGTNIMQAYDLARTTYGELDEQTLRIDELAGQSLFYDGKYQEAEQRLRRTIEQADAKLGRTSDISLAARSSLATSYAQSGRTDDAVAMLPEVIEGMTKSRGADDQNTLAAQGTLAILLTDQGKLDQAIALFERNDKSLMRVHGPEAPVTLTNQNNLGWALQQQNKHEEAAKILEGVVAARKRVLGEDHPETSQSVHNLAISYRRLGREQEATTLYEQSVAMDRKNLGSGHPETLLSIANLARVYMEAKVFDKAEPLFVESEAGFRKTLGTGHAYTAQTILGHGICLRMMERLEPAEAKLKEAFTLLGAIKFPGGTAQRRAAQELVELYTKASRAAEAAEWQATVERMKAAEQAPK